MPVLSNQSQQNYIHICGAYRSGTTITEKVLNNHEHLCIASQPFPVLYIMFKEKFNILYSINQRYPLDHCFLQKRYDVSAFFDFLDSETFTDNDMSEFKRKMKANVGVWTPIILDYL
ncbi:MAG: hypothetical protein ACOC2H_07295, partial [Spirochaetota bacterium]